MKFIDDMPRLWLRNARHLGLTKSPGQNITVTIQGSDGRPIAVHLQGPIRPATRHPNATKGTTGILIDGELVHLQVNHRGLGTRDTSVFCPACGRTAYALLRDIPQNRWVCRACSRRDYAIKYGIPPKTPRYGLDKRRRALGAQPGLDGALPHHRPPHLPSPIFRDRLRRLVAAEIRRAAKSPTSALIPMAAPTTSKLIAELNAALAAIPRPQLDPQTVLEIAMVRPDLVPPPLRKAYAKALVEQRGAPPASSNYDPKEQRR